MAVIAVMHPYIGKDDAGIARLIAAGHTVRFHHQQAGDVWSPSETIATLRDVDVALANLEQYDDATLAALPQLKVLCKLGAGYDNIDVAAATRRGIAVCTGGGTNASAVADFAFAMMLALARHIVLFHERVLAGRWTERPAGKSFDGTTLGVIGTGRIGRGVCRRARGFDMRLLACDIAPDFEWARGAGVTYVDLPTLLRESDWVTIHTSLNPASRNLIGSNELALMKSTAYLINTARGGVVDEEALYLALVERRIAGAGIDVFVEEPPANISARFLTLENVLLSPHTAGGSLQGRQQMRDMAAYNALAVLSGTEPYLCLNSEVLPAVRDRLALAA